MLRNIQKHLPTVQGRLIAGLALVIAIVVGLWPDHPRAVDPVRVGFIMTAAIAWLFAELAGAGVASEHDVNLFDTFRKTVKEAEKDFLRQQEFHFSFVYRKSDGLREMSYWTGAAYEFVDEKLQAKWKPLVGQVDEFVRLIAQYSVPLDGNSGLATVHPTHGDPDNPEPWVSVQISELNNAASALAGSLDDFERFARKRLGL